MISTFQHFKILIAILISTTFSFGQMQVNLSNTYQSVCNNGVGIYELQMSDGQIPYTVTMEPGTNASYNWVNDSVVYIAIFNPGVFSITVEDATTPTPQTYTNVIILELVSHTLNQFDVTPDTCSNGLGSFTPGIAISQWGSGMYPPYFINVFDNVGNSTGIIGENQTLQGLDAGVYTYTVINGNGCESFPQTFVINDYNPLLVSAVTVDTDCGGACTGEATAIVSGANGNVYYLWSNGAVGPNVTGLCAGDFINFCVVMDDYGCTANMPTFTINNNEGTGLSYDLNVGDADCGDGFAMINVTGGTSPFSVVWDNGTIDPLNMFLSAGTYSAVVTDAAGCFDTVFVTVGQSPFVNGDCGFLDGIVYNDVNNNCIQDVGEVGIPNQVVSTDAGYYAITDANGYYSMSLPYAGYTIAPPSAQPWISSCNTNWGVVLDINNPGQTSDIPMTLDPDNDLSVSIFNSIIRPFDYTTFYIQVCNNSSSDQGTSTLTFDLTNDFSFISASTTPTSTTNNMIEIAIPGIPNGGCVSIQVLALANGLMPGSVVSHCANIESDNFEVDLSNNDYCLGNIVVASYDPNDKQVNHAEEILVNDTLFNYQVRFQNTGTSYAQDVFILDSLDSDFDMSTFKFLGSSHPCEVFILNDRIVRFQFDDIYLPDSTTNEELSKGFLLYSIESNPDVVVGTSFMNTAHIYFDYNPAIVTNTTSNLIVEPMIGINEEVLMEVSIAPNPAMNELNVVLEEDALIQLISANGTVLMEDYSFDKQATFDLTSFNAGVYLLRVTSNKGSRSFKVIKI